VYGTTSICGPGCHTRLVHNDWHACTHMLAHARTDARTPAQTHKYTNVRTHNTQNLFDSGYCSVAVQLDEPLSIGLCFLSWCFAVELNERYRLRLCLEWTVDIYRGAAKFVPLLGCGEGILLMCSMHANKCTSMFRFLMCWYLLPKSEIFVKFLEHPCQLVYVCTSSASYGHTGTIWGHCE